MKKTISTFTLTFCATLTFAQRIQISEPYTTPKSTSDFYHHNGQVIAESRFTGKPGTIERYELEDDGLQYKGESQLLEAKEGVDNFQFRLQKGSMVSELLWVVEEQKRLLVKTAYSIDDAKQLTFNEPILELTNVAYLNGYELNMDVGASMDSSLILVVYKHNPKIKENHLNKDVVEYILLSDELEQLSRESVEMPYVETEMQRLSSCVNREGVIFTIIFCTKSGEEGFKLLVLKEGELEVFPIQWEFSGKIPRKVVLKENAMRGVVLAGLSADVSTGEKGYDGIFAIHISEEGVVESKSSHEFSGDLILQGRDQKYVTKMLEKQQKGENISIGAIDITEVKIHHDNSVTFLCEAAMPESYVTFADVYVSQFGPEGELNWINKIAKNQSGGGIYFDFDVDNLNVFYLDNPLNNNKKENEAVAFFPISSVEGDLVCQRINMKSGKIEKYILFNQKTVNESPLIQLSVNDMIKLEEGKYAMEAALKKNTKVMVTFTVED